MRSPTLVQRLMSRLIVLPAAGLAAAIVINGATRAYSASAQSSTALGSYDKAVMTIMLFMIGSLLTLFKASSQLLYGILEVGLALGSIWNILSRSMSNNRLANAMALVASVYFVTRGLTDMNESEGKKLFDFDAFKKALFGPRVTHRSPETKPLAT